MNTDQAAAGLISSVSGIRGIVGESLTPEVALAFGRALGTFVSGGAVVLGRDGRPSGEMLHDAAAAGLMASGCGVHPLSIVPTPTVGLAIRELRAAGGIQITASHNAAPYNGLKLFGPDGRGLSPASSRQILELFRRREFRRSDWASVGAIQFTAFNPLRMHLSRLLDHANVAAVRERKFRVLLDANHGAGGPLGLLLLAALGCHVVKIGCEPDGHFAHEPEPTSANLQEIAPAVGEEKCAVGFALDPDADRLALIDETGRYLGEEFTLALAAEARLRHDKGTIVANLSTSRLVDSVAGRHGCTVCRVPVGEVHVAAKMAQTNALFGGEGNGGVIDPRLGLVRDSFIGMVLILNLLAESGKRLSELAAELPSLVIVKEKYHLPHEQLPALYQQLLARWPEATANREDGLRLDWPDRWLHVRPSNTEPIIRVIAEAASEEEARVLCHAVKDATA